MSRSRIGVPVRVMRDVLRKCIPAGFGARSSMTADPRIQMLIQQAIDDARGYGMRMQ
jgi:hypothetical protein